LENLILLVPWKLVVAMMRICYSRQILAQMQMNETNIRSVAPATEDEISALPVITITQAELGKLQTA